MFFSSPPLICNLKTSEINLLSFIKMIKNEKQNYDFNRIMTLQCNWFGKIITTVS